MNTPPCPTCGKLINVNISDIVDRMMTNSSVGILEKNLAIFDEIMILLDCLEIKSDEIEKEKIKKMKEKINNFHSMFSQHTENLKGKMS
jgi:hypothetical protein